MPLFEIVTAHMGLIISDFYWIILTIDLKICEAIIIKWSNSTTL